MKFLLKFILILLFINIIKGQTCIPDYEFSNGVCNNQEYRLFGPILSIKNYNIYSEIKCEPKPILSYLDNDVYKIQLDYNTNYNFTLTSPNCVEPYVFNQITNDDNMLIVQQPKCPNSFTVVNFNSKISNTDYFINDISVSLPYEFFSYDVNGYVFRIGSDCSSTFYIKPESKDKFPNLTVSNDICGSGGKIIISNANDYDLITVSKVDGSVISPSSTIDSVVSYENLVIDDYLIVFESKECGKQLFSVTIQKKNPTPHIELLDDSCPNKPEYRVTFDGDFTYGFIYDGTISGSGNIIKLGGKSNRITFNSDKCDSFDFYLPLLDSTPPIHYTLIPTSEDLEFCDGRFNVTLLYDPNVILGYINIEKLTNGVESISIENYNSFEALEGEVYGISVQSGCFNNKITLTAPSRKPKVTYSKSTGYCNELIDITVNNYLDFTSLRLYTSHGIYLPAEDGVFRQVPNQNYNLEYIYRNCSESYSSIDIGSSNPLNVYYTTNIISYPNCESVEDPGLVEYILYDKNTNRQLKNGSIPFFYNDISPSKYLVSYQNCEPFEIQFKVEIPEPVYIVKPISKSVCKFSERDGGGSIEIISNYSINEISINDDKREPPGQVYGVTPSFSIQIYYNYHSCPHVFTTFTLGVEFPDFDISYDTIPVTDCTQTNGGIKVLDYSKYSKLEINGENLLENNGEFTNKASDWYYLEFEIDLGSGGNSKICSGTKMLFIPTSIDVDIKYKTFRKYYCSEDGGRVVINSINDKSGKSLMYDDTQKLVEIYKSPDNPNNIYYIKSGSCSWGRSFSLASPIYSPIFTPVLDDYYVDSQCIGHARYKVQGIDNDVNYYLSQNPTDKYIFVSSNEEDVTHSYSFGMCTETLTFKSIQPTIPKINYTIQINGDANCLSTYTSINITVIDHHKYNSLEYDGISINPNTGEFTYVKPDLYLTGFLYNLDCKLNQIIQVSRPSTSFSKLVVNETCYSSLNGELSIEDSRNSDYYFVQAMDSHSTFYPVKSNEDLLSFNYLGSQEIRIIKIDKSRPTCYEQEFFTMNSNEPNLSFTTILNQCDNGTINIFSSNSDLIGDINLVNGSIDTTPSQTIIPIPLVSSALSSSSSLSSPSSLSSVFTNLTSGNYTITYQTNQDYCRRKLVLPVSIQVEKCQTNSNNSDKDDKLGLKIGLPIGFFFFFVAVCAVVYIYRKKLSNSKGKGVKMNSFK